MNNKERRNLILILLLVLLALWVNPNRPGAEERVYRYEAIVKCQGNMQEDQAAHLKLVRYEPLHDGLKLVYRCQRNY